LPKKEAKKNKVHAYTIEYTNAFWQDIKDVINWYDVLSTNLTNRFLNEIWFAESRISLNPTAFRKVTRSGFRKISLKKFPYKIFFRTEEKTVFILALIHTSRSNKYIKRRLKQ
jgi:toxin ParE1/3/4